MNINSDAEQLGVHVFTKIVNLMEQGAQRQLITRLQTQVPGLEGVRAAEGANTEDWLQQNAPKIVAYFKQNFDPAQYRRTA